MKDQRDECRCHRECTVLPHECEKPCIYPDCLNEAEVKALLLDMQGEHMPTDGRLDYCVCGTSWPCEMAED
jgi:hypothetical protein